VALAVLASACAGAGRARSRSATAGSAASVALPEVASTAREQVPSALDDPAGPGLPKALVDPGQIRSGGPPPDGIPAVDHPRFERAGQVGWLKADEPVLAAEVNGEARAYPVQILIWHEIVNDTVGGIPIAITYCPLCNTAIAYDRRAGGRVLDFGTSGKLYNSDLVAYDRQTRSLWVQFLGQAVAGVLTGTQLRAYPVATVSWADWRRANPSGWVLSRDTGFVRDYGTNPYPGYDDIHSSPFLFSGKTDGRLAAMTRVVGIDQGSDAVTVTLDVLRRSRIVEVTVAGQPIVVWLAPGTASALVDSTIAGGPDVGATGAFDPVLDGRALHFDPTPGGFRDRETGTTWDVLGRGVSGPLVNRQLAPVVHVDSFWFAWAAFRPTTRVILS
jgi:uncharacterized protein DUF3179